MNDYGLVYSNLSDVNLIIFEGKPYKLENSHETYKFCGMLSESLGT